MKSNKEQGCGTNRQASQPRLLLLAHYCHPEMGSEPGIGWNRALQAARGYPTCVLCDEEFNRAGIERYIERHGQIDNLQFVFVPPNRFEKFLSRVPGLYYLTQNWWHRRAYKIARQLHEELRFDLVHQVTMAGFREPGYLWKLDAPFVWGPVGGAQNYPWRFLTGAGMPGAIAEAVRNVLNAYQIRFARRVTKAARKAKVFLTATTTNARALSPWHGAKPRVMLDTGVRLKQTPPSRNFDHGGPLRLLWSGVFEHRKALHLLLQALAALPTHVTYELHILGRGPLENRWKRMARRLNVEQHCRWLGWLEQENTRAENLWADLFVFTSLRDTCGTVVLEAFGAGTPALCLDHQGMADVVTPQCGIKIPVTTPRQVITGLPGDCECTIIERNWLSLAAELLRERTITPGTGRASA